MGASIWDALVFIRVELDRMITSAFSPLERLGHNTPIVEANGAKSELGITHVMRADVEPARIETSYILYQTPPRRSLRLSQKRLRCSMDLSLSGETIAKGVRVKVDAASFNPLLPEDASKLKMLLEFDVAYDGKSCGWHVVDHSQLERASVLVRETMHYFTSVRRDRDNA